MILRWTIPGGPLTPVSRHRLPDLNGWPTTPASSHSNQTKRPPVTKVPLELPAGHAWRGAEHARETAIETPARKEGATMTEVTASHDQGGQDATSSEQPLSETEAQLIDAYWRAANYLSVGQIYLLDNPLLREPLKPEHVKPRLLGHWGTTPGLNFIYAHMNRVIRNSDLDAIYVMGPGTGPGSGGKRLPRGNLQRVLPRHLVQRRRHAGIVPPVQLSRRHPVPRRP